MNLPPPFRPDGAGQRLLVGLGCLLCLMLTALAADSPSAEAVFKAATNAFEDRNFDWAEKAFGEYAAKFPESPRLAEAILRQAECRFELQKYQAVVTLLTSRMATAGAWADRYRFLAAEAQFRNNDFVGAATAFADLLREFPNSTLRLRASYGEADARFRLNDFKGVEQLLTNPAGAFQQAAQKDTNDVDVVRGYLLLGESYFEQKNYEAAERTMNQLGSRKLTPESDWRRQFLIANSQLANRRSDEALQRVTNLVALAIAATNPVLQATSLLFQGAILESKQPDAAIKTYEAISGIKGIAAVQNRQAALKIAALEMEQNRLTNAIARLTRFAAQFPQDPDLALILLTLGEAHLKHARTLSEPSRAGRPGVNRSAATNALLQARAQFDLIINTLTNSPQVGKAWLNRGWCAWDEARLTGLAGKYAEGQKAYLVAAERLPASDDQALAWFKAADCQFEQRDYANAIQTYQTFLERFGKSTALKTVSCDQALYQIVRAQIEMDDYPGARRTWEKLFADYPKSELCDDSLFALSQGLLNRGHAAEARQSLLRYEKLFAASPFLPEARLLLGRTYAQESNWPAALQELDRWVAQHSNHVSTPQAEFERAWVNYRADKETNALNIYTNFVVRFPNHALTPLAQLWVGDYYYRQGGAEYHEAEKYYQTLYQSTNAAVGELKYRAWLMAAKAAFLRQKPTDARSYLTNLLAERNCPESVLPEAYFLLGEVSIADQPPLGSTNNLDRFLNAIVAFSYVTNYASAGRLEPLARGQIANCHFQFATQDPKRYADATNEWHRVLESRLASVAARNQAEYGLAKVYERQAELKQGDPKSTAEQRALLEAAWDRYRNIIYGNLKPGERLDPFWVKEAGLAVGALALRLQKIPEAIGLYRRLTVDLPALRETWENKIGELSPETVK